MKSLASLPPGVSETLDLLGPFDAALMHGFGRLGDEQRAALDAIAGALAGSPLGPVVAEAVAAVGRNEFVARSFLALASARVGLLGAVHDALLAQACEALGRAVPSVEEAPAPPAGASAAALGSVQQWLMELAIAGLKNLDENAVSPFAATLEILQSDPELTGIAALLTGFSNELLRALPASRQAEQPAFRWADLWCAAMIRTQQLPPRPTFRTVDGVVTPLGLDVHMHENFACAVLYGVLDDGEARVVRLPFTGYKVDVVSGAEAWDLFDPFEGPILSALAGRKTLEITGAELRSDGDLVLAGPPKTGGAADPFALADRLTVPPSPPALFRHPIHLAVPALLTAGHGLPVAVERLASDAEMTHEVVAGASDLIGLLRFDQGGWRVQPLCARLSKKKIVISGESLAAARKKLKHRSMQILRERSSRLLRGRV